MTSYILMAPSRSVCWRLSFLISHHLPRLFLGGPLTNRYLDDSPSEALPTSAAPCSPPPPWSPTENNTPTTCSPSPAPIRPTRFTTDTTQSYRQRIKVLELQRQLNGLPDDLVREALAKSGHQHLLAPATYLQPPSKDTKLLSDPVSPSRALANTEDVVLAARVDKIIAQRLDKLTKDAFKSLTQRRLHALVESQLPVAAELFLNGAVADHRDQFYEDCKANEVTVREYIDESVTEIRDVTDECTKELSELAQQCMDSLDEHSRNVDASAEQELSKLKRWFAELAQGFFDRKIDVGTVSSNKTRRISM
jgi:hypothetical protein